MKKFVLLFWVMLSAMPHTFAQNFSCTAGSPVRVQFTGCASTPTWADNGTTATTLRTISSAGTYTVNCGGTLHSFRITNVNACPSFTCDLSLNASVNPVTAGYLRRSIDYRSVLGEVIRKHLGSTQNQLNRIIPGYATAGENLLGGGISSIDNVAIRGELGLL